MECGNLFGVNLGAELWNLIEKNVFFLLFLFMVNIEWDYA